MRKKRAKLFVSFLGAALCSFARAEAKPNFIVILADDLGYGDLSCYGHSTIKTPNLDKMAAGGMKFTSFYASGNVCSPSRAGLLTGRYQHRFGLEEVLLEKAEDLERGLPASETTFAETLKGAGYTTALFGKWHLGFRPEFNPVLHGFDRFIGTITGNIDYQSHISSAGNPDWLNGTQLQEEPGYATHLITRHSVEFIKEQKKNPFCIYMAYTAPHSPFQGPGDKADRSTTQVNPLVGSVKDRDRAYTEMVQEMDAGIGEVIRTLEKEGLAENTFIFFCSDNGQNTKVKIASAGPLKGSKAQIWEGGSRVPGIAYWPGKITPSVTDVPVIGLDIFPTLCRFAGVNVSADLDGTDLSGLLLRKQELPARTLFWRAPGGKSARNGAWKYVYEFRTKQEFLFNLDSDIGETINLAAANPEKFQQLKSELAAWEKSVGRCGQIVP